MKAPVLFHRFLLLGVFARMAMAFVTAPRSQLSLGRTSLPGSTTLTAPRTYRLSLIGNRAVASDGESKDGLTGPVHVLGAAFKASLLTDVALIKTVAIPLKPLVAVRLSIWAILFAMYRAYRGFFVIVPVVFQEVQSKLVQGLTEAETELNADVDPSTGKLRMRSAIVINCLAAIVTVLYSAKAIFRGIIWSIGRVFSRGPKDTEVAPPPPVTAAPSTPAPL